MRAASEIVASGRLGRIVAVSALFWLYKPDDYFDMPWRREPGAGPVFLNLIHDVDNLRALLGEVVSVQAVESNTVRGHPVEDTAAIILQFASGALATISVCDTAVAPWSWEMTTGENPAYPRGRRGLLSDRRHARIAVASPARHLEQRGSAQLVGAASARAHRHRPERPPGAPDPPFRGCDPRRRRPPRQRAGGPANPGGHQCHQAGGGDRRARHLALALIWSFFDSLRHRVDRDPRARRIPSRSPDGPSLSGWVCAEEPVTLIVCKAAASIDQKER